MRRQTAKLFMNGRSRAVRLPAGFRFEGSEVFISRAGEKVILSPKPTSWDAFFEATERGRLPISWPSGWTSCRKLGNCFNAALHARYRYLELHHQRAPTAGQGAP
jgi:virulence-associated protein VagC